jgi:hypothetical protein
MCFALACRLLAINGVGGIGCCVLSYLAKIEAKLIPPWVLAEGVHSAATLTLLNIPTTASLCIKSENFNFTFQFTSLARPLH